MASRPRSTLRRRLGVLLAGAAVVTSLTAAAAQAAAPTTTEPARDTGRQPPGYVLERGRFTPVTVPPGQEDPSALGIGPFDLNDRRDIVGTYDDVAANATRGFLLERGRFTTVHVPGAMSTQAQGINNRGQIVGVYSNDSNAISAPDATRRGFLLDRGRYLRLDFPDARKSQAFDINDRGQVVGEYLDDDGRGHGYLWERGRFTPIDDVAGQPSTTPTGINNRGQITGIAGPFEASVGFVLDRGRFTTFRIPGAPVTLAYGINDQGQIVGHTVSNLTAPTPTVSGFLRDARGRLTAINRPGAAGTLAFGINNRGQIAIIAPDPPPSPPAAEAAPVAPHGLTIGRP
jgi:probable HAF family extracellular repeat protein